MLSNYINIDDVDRAAALFNLERGGHIYSRIWNPTVGVLKVLKKFITTNYPSTSK